MNIGYVCSDKYARFAGISMLSLFEMNKNIEKITVFIFDDNISSQNKQRILEIARKYKRSIVFKNGIGELQKILSSFSVDPFLGSNYTYAKIFPYVFAKEIDKILILDADTIINQDLSNLYDTDISNYYCAAVPEIAAYYKSSEDGAIIYKNKFYFNSGVLLCNLKKMQTKEYIKKIVNAKEFYIKQLKLADQSLLNLSLDTRDILPVNFRYNYNINVNIFDELKFNIYKKYDEYELGFHYKDYSKCINQKDIAIIHYLGAYRPWLKGNEAPYADLWFKYFKQSPWARDKDIKKMLNFSFLVKKYFFNIPICKRSENKISFPLGSIVNKPGMYKISILGLPIFKKKRTELKHYIKVLGIPVYYKNNMEKIILDQFEKIKELNYQIIWLPQKVATLHQQIFPQFKNIHNGEDVVIVGCGPTLYQYTPIKNAKHISLNRAFLYDKINYQYAFIWDFLGQIRDNDQIIDKYLDYNCIKFAGKFLHDNIKFPEYLENRKGDLYRCYSSSRWGYNGLQVVDTTIHADISMFPLADFMSISFGALHFASWTHPKRIFLVGLDTAENGSFDGRQNPYHFPEMLMGYGLFKKFMKFHYPEIEIISINPIGLRGMFRDVYTKEYLERYPELEKQNVEILR